MPGPDQLEPEETEADEAEADDAPIELAEPWDDPDEEYDVLVSLMVPVAQAQLDAANQNWDALDTKALGVLTIPLAVVAGLVAAHDLIYSLWWLPAAGCAVAGGLFVASVWPRSTEIGADLLDFHAEARKNDSLAAARAMVEILLEARTSVEATLVAKGRLFVWGLAVLAVSLLGCIPVVLLQP